MSCKRCEEPVKMFTRCETCGRWWYMYPSTVGAVNTLTASAVFYGSRAIVDAYSGWEDSAKINARVAARNATEAIRLLNDAAERSR